nr:response regulator [uncultured Holophaga sp.]
MRTFSPPACDSSSREGRCSLGPELIDLALDTLPMGVAIYDTSGHLAFYNRAARELTGLHAPELIGTSFSPFADPGESLEAFRIAAGGHAWEGPTAFRTREGAPRVLGCRLSPLGGDGAVLMVFQDGSHCTPLTHLERETARMEAVGNYLEGVRGEVDDILTLAASTSELLSWRLPQDPPMAELATTLIQACRRGMELHRRASHLATGRDPGVRPIDFTSCLRTSLVLLDPSLPRQIRLQSALTSGVWVQGNPGLLHGLISILVAGTARAMGEGPGLIRLTLSELVEETRCEALVILQGTPCLPAQGTVLPGQSVAQSIARTHGGELAWTLEGGGLTWVLRLPCASIPFTPQLGEASGQDLHGHERLGLLVQDPVLANTLRVGLEGLGYAVTCFDGLEPLRVGEEQPIRQDVWVIDPPPGPWELPTWIAEPAASSPVPILLLGSQSPLVRDTVLPCLPKPFSISDLGQSLRALIRSSTGLRELGPPPPEVRPPEPHPSVRTVLVAEDSRVFRNFLRSSLQHAGYQVLEATDGAAALDLFVQASLTHPVDLLITDIIMPRMDGLELIEEIRRLDHRMPIAVITSVEDQQTAKTALQLGVNDFLSKPFNTAQLLDCVTRTLRHQEELHRDEETARSVRLAHCSLLATQERDLPIYSIYQPLSDAGGDIFRCYRLPEGDILFLLADIAGHSVVSSYAVASLLGIFSTLVPHFEGLRPLALGLNHAIQNGPFPDVPACALLGIWTPRTGRLHLLNAGLPHGLVHRFDRECTEALEINGTPIGILPEPLLEERVLHLQAGDRCLFATDGFFDACPPDGSAFWTQAAASWTRLACSGIEDSLNAICREVRQHLQGTQTDDLLLVGFEQPQPEIGREEILMLIPSAPRYVDTVCLRLKDYMAAFGDGRVFSPSKRFEIILAAREALTNAVFHGNRERKELRVCIHAWTGSDGSRFFLRILDEGPGFELPDRADAPDPTSERGRGIPIMRHYCSRLSLIGGELTLEFEMEDPPDALS